MFSDSKVVVTGGAIRIGKAITEAFAAVGSTVRIHFNSSLTEAFALCQSLSEHVNIKHELIQCDFSIAEIKSLRAVVKDCDILVNNASIYYLPDSIDLSERRKISKLQLKINYEIPILLMELFAEENKRGCIINILDATTLQPDDSAGSYFQSKYLLKEATIKQAIALAPSIRVNAVAPGAILPPSHFYGSEMKKSIALMPLRKAPSVRNVADTCLFLAQNEGITGEIIKVDSGRHLVTD